MDQVCRTGGAACPRLVAQRRPWTSVRAAIVWGVPSNADIPGPLVVAFVTDVLLRSRVEEGLKAAGYRFVGAAGPTRLRERIEQESPVASLVDLEARDALNAVETLAARGIPVLGFCGHTEQDLRARGLELGCRRVITRGEVAVKLDRVLESLLGEVSTSR